MAHFTALRRGGNGEKREREGQNRSPHRPDGKLSRATNPRKTIRQPVGLWLREPLAGWRRLPQRCPTQTSFAAQNRGSLVIV